MKAVLNKKLNYYEHSICGGSIMYDGIRTESKPVDFAIIGTESGALIIVKKKITKFVTGGCLKCGKEGNFELSSKFKTTKKLKKLPA